MYRKHHPPSLDDEVWRLEKIGKDGAFHKRLADNGINTVQEFLKNLVMDQDRLRSVRNTTLFILELVTCNFWMTSLSNIFFMRPASRHVKQDMGSNS